MVTLSAERMTVSKKVSYGFPAMVITRMVVVICKATLWVLEAIVFVTAVTNNVIPRIRKLDQHPPLLMPSKRSSRRFRYSLWVPSLQLLFPTEMINGSPRICNLGLYAADGSITEGMASGSHQQDLANCQAFKSISEKIENVKQLSSEACLFKVHEELRKTNRDAYTPLITSIGPYHHRDPKLSKMERLKALYLQSFLKRAHEKGFGVADCLKKLKDLKDRAERYYGDDHDIKVGDEFVEMLLLDGCFIVEFLIKVAYERKGAEKYDPIFKICGTKNSVVRDMLLLENQLPFFVLRELYDMISIPSKLEFSEMVKRTLASVLPKINVISILSTNVNIQEIKHFLEVVHIICQPRRTSGLVQPERDSTRFCCWFWKQPQAGVDIESHYCFLCKFGNCKCLLCMFGKQPSTGDLDSESSHIPTATELREAGVDFKKVGKIGSINPNETTSLFDINFNHSVLEIPSFGLYDESESFFRNLIAYELYSPDLHTKYFVSFAIFMDDLINTDKDVILLRKKGIFVSGLGDDGTSAEDETARLYQEFVESLFQVDDVPGSKAFVRGGTSIPMLEFLSFLFSKWSDCCLAHCRRLFFASLESGVAAAISSNSPTSSPSPVPSQSPSSLLAFAILVVFPKKEPLRSKVGMGDGIAMAHQAQAIVSNIEFLIWSIASLRSMKLMRVGKIKAAYKLLEEMGSKGYPPDIVTFNCFLKVLYHNNDRDEALRLYHKMIEVGCVPSVQTFNMLIAMFFKINDVDGAFETWWEMDNSGCARDTVIQRRTV
nr:UPF0481 protein At3g47200-like [Ipomoea batatas]